MTSLIDILILVLGAALALFGSYVQHKLSMKTDNRKALLGRQLEMAAQVVSSYEALKSVSFDLLAVEAHDVSLGGEEQHFGETHRRLTEEMKNLQTELGDDLEGVKEAMLQPQFAQTVIDLQQKMAVQRSMFADHKEVTRQREHLQALRGQYVTGPLAAAREKLLSHRQCVAKARLVLPGGLCTSLDRIEEATAPLQEAVDNINLDALVEATKELNEAVNQFTVQFRTELKVEGE